LYSIIDVETTGGNAWTDRITEIAVYIHDGNKVIRHFSSLVNPERSIPPFVVRLTGITDAMVEKAPLFEEIAREIVEMTEGTIFVGHNVQFDYNFVRQEFKNLGYLYDRKTLCTCKLGRKVLPGHPSYSLGKLCQSLDIKLVGRHRAAGDALATVALFERIMAADRYGEMEMALKPVRHANLPECLDQEKVYALPERPGVYYFHGKDGEIIYIGKSKNIRKRVLGHFKKKNPLARDARLSAELSDVSCHVTGTELIALLLESEEIKKFSPRYNHAQKSKEFAFGVFDKTDANGYLSLYADRISKSTAIPLACFRNKEQALNAIHLKSSQHQLCTRLTGMEKGEGACFNYQIKKCHGACIQVETPETYNKRVESAIASFNFKHPDFLIIDQGRSNLEKSVVRVENGQYSGFGYFDPAVTGNNIDIIKESTKKYSDTPDCRHIIFTHLRSVKNIQLLTL
jgi:DNA polymerase-3 subunit epsilon